MPRFIPVASRGARNSSTPARTGLASALRLERALECPAIAFTARRKRFSLAARGNPRGRAVLHAVSWCQLWCHLGWGFAARRCGGVREAVRSKAHGSRVDTGPFRCAAFWCGGCRVGAGSPRTDFKSRASACSATRATSISLMCGMFSRKAASRDM